jgi:hypothetical protein
MTLRMMFATVAMAAAGAAQAHCDTLDGPVVASARKALDSGNPAPALVWVRAADEAQIRSAFDEALAVRKGGGAARALADRYFFETLVRIHRAGEGADFTGLKPAGTVNAAVLAADKALASGDLKPVDTLIAKRAHQGLEKNFHEVMELRAKAKDPTDVAAGRAAASAYVEYVHYVERLHDAAETLSPHHAEAEQPSKHSH